MAQSVKASLRYFLIKENRLGKTPMSTVGLESLDHTVQLSHIWINDLDERLGWNKRARAYRLLKAVLHSLRDWLQINEAADLAAQLPGLLRGVHHEQWRPAATPIKKRSKADFNARVEESFKADPLARPSQAIMTVFNLLSEKVTAGEIDNVRRALIEDLRHLWPEPYVAAGAARR
jgi:uncharacterized protein (DUF2267 family)